MTSCDYCNEEIDSLPHKCKFCGGIHCSKHLLPESHECIGLEQYEEKKRERWKSAFLPQYPRSNKQKNIIIQHNKKYSRKENIFIKTKSYFSYWYDNLKDWLVKRNHHKYNSHRINYVLKIIFWFIISSLALYLFYSNASQLNNNHIWIIKLGGVLILISLFFVIKFLWKILKELTNFTKRQRNWIKLIMVLLLLVLTLHLYNNRATIIDSSSNTINNIAFNLLIPVEIDSQPHLYSNNKTNSSLGNFINGIIDPKSQIDISQLELEVHRLINVERKKNGLSKLSFDSNLADIARAHSEDMAQNNFFEHTNLIGQDPTDRANSADYSCYKDYGYYYTDGIAENIMETPIYSNVEGCGSTTNLESLASCIVNGWMNSPGHRANILTLEYDKEGIGVAYSSDDKAYTTQDFC